MASLNNVNVGVLEQVAGEGAGMKRKQKLEGEWLLAEGGPQFRAEIAYEGGKAVFESDQPRTLGGGGTRPGPLHYCFYGLLSCYTATFATVAAQMGIKLRKLSSSVEGDLNFSRVFGLSRDPIMEEVRLTLQVESDAPLARLEEVDKLAHERCPAVFALTEGVKLSTRLVQG